MTTFLLSSRDSYVVIAPPSRAAPTRLDGRVPESHHARQHHAYNARRGSMLDGKTPDQVIAERLTTKPELTNAML
jgi:hypothetical protein